MKRNEEVSYYQVLTGRSMPLVSVIIPCYNTARFVREAVSSVFAQTFTDYEAVVINDGSPDTPELEEALTPWAQKIIYLKTENRGLAGARNAGIRASTGELIALLDSDDAWEPNYLEVQVRKLTDDPTADIVYPNALIFGDTPDAGRFIMDGSPSKGAVTFSSLVQEECCVVVSVLARRAALERAGLFDVSLRSCEDFDMWVRCVKTGSRIIYHDQPLLRYRRRRDSLSADPVWMSQHVLKVLTKLRAIDSLTAEERQILEKAIRSFTGRRLFHEGKRAFLAGDAGAAADLLRQANAYLGSGRVRLILLLLRTMPRLARFAYMRLSGGEASMAR
jgi:glycosyltransferase involved in cell wall biosynthesis